MASTKMAQPPTSTSAPGVDLPEQHAMSNAYGIVLAVVAVLILAAMAAAYFQHRKKGSKADTRAKTGD